jgi:hypothetical protein
MYLQLMEIWDTEGKSPAVGNLAGPLEITEMQIED